MISGVIAGVLGTLVVYHSGLAQTPPFPMIIDGSGASIDRDTLRKATTIVADKTPDPYSVQFRRIGKSNDGSPTVCGQFNAKNKFGAYSGFLDFIAFIDKNSSFETIDYSAMPEDSEDNIDKKIKVLQYNVMLLKTISSSCSVPTE